MLAQDMTTHKLYSVLEVQNPVTFEMEQSKTFIKDFDCFIAESSYQAYINSNLDLQQYNYMGITFTSGIAKGMYVDNVEVTHVMPLGRQYIIYLKAVQ